MDTNSVKTNKIRPDGKASFDYYALLFFLACVLGWLWEVAIYLVKEHKFVNRGILKGPWLPIYGAGALFLYFILKICKNKPLPVFLLSMGVCSTLEYGAGYFLERMWGVRWWDYSGLPFNLNGYICLLSALMFGAGGILLNFVLVPLYTKLYGKIPRKMRYAAAIIMLALFVMDGAYSADFPNAGRGITYRGQAGIILREPFMGVMYHNSVKNKFFTNEQSSFCEYCAYGPNIAG